MRRFLFAASALAAFCAPAHASSVIDQSNLATLPSGGQYTLVGAAGNFLLGQNHVDIKLAQSVTVGLSGQLTEVDLQLQSLGVTGFQYTVTLAKDVVFNPDNSVASYTLLAPSYTLPDSSLGSLVDIDTSADNIQLNAGDVFWIALSVAGNDTGLLAWVNGTKTADGTTTWLDYAGGSGRAAPPITSGSNIAPKYNTLETFNGSHDFAFRTWMDTGAVPEPASWAMMIAGFAVVGSALRRRSRVAASFA